MVTSRGSWEIQAALLGRGQTELAPIAFKGASPVPKPHDRSLSDCTRAARVVLNQRTQDFPIPGLRMLDIEHGVNRKIMPLPRRHAEPAQSLVHVSGPRRRCHLDDPQRSD